MKDFCHIKPFTHFTILGSLFKVSMWQSEKLVTCYKLVLKGILSLEKVVAQYEYPSSNT